MITYEEVNPTIIPNTTMKKMLSDGVHRTYVITPNEGYVLHDKLNDTTLLDPETQEPKFALCYASGGASCGANYDFTSVQVTDENGAFHIGYGAVREFFARLESEVPADQIFGGGNDRGE